MSSKRMQNNSVPIQCIEMRLRINQNVSYSCRFVSLSQTLRTANSRSTVRCTSVNHTSYCGFSFWILKNFDCGRDGNRERERDVPFGESHCKMANRCVRAYINTIDSVFSYRSSRQHRYTWQRYWRTRRLCHHNLHKWNTTTKWMSNQPSVCDSKMQCERDREHWTWTATGVQLIFICYSPDWWCTSVR